MDMTYAENKARNTNIVHRVLERRTISKEQLMDTITRTNLLYTMADMLEMLLIDTEERHRRIGYELRQDVKRNYKAAVRHCKLLRFDVKMSEETTQESLGRDSDMLLAMLMLMIDRCGDDDMKLWKLYNYIKAMPSKHLMDVSGCDEAFEHLFENN